HRPGERADARPAVRRRPRTGRPAGPGARTGERGTRVPMNWLLVYIPLGLLGFTRWLSWLVRQVPATLYRPVANDYRLPVTVVVPVYQEDPAVFADAL